MDMGEISKSYLKFILLIFNYLDKKKDKIQAFVMDIIWTTIYFDY